jgi:hypothetical protein
MDIIGPMPAAQWKLKYDVVAVEYFSKWIEAKALAIITLATIQKSSSRTSFATSESQSMSLLAMALSLTQTFRSFYSQVGTNIHFALVRHRESNGLVKRANIIILLGITTSLVGLPKGKWIEELIKVVWNHNTSISRSTCFTPFNLLFWDEVVAPEETKLGSARVITSIEDQDNEFFLKMT